MADGARIADVIARVESAGAEPSDEAAGEASQENGAASAEGSASADVSTQTHGTAAAPSEQAAPTSPEATNAPDETELRAKLERDRERREAKAAIRKAKQEAEARAKLEKELAEERAKREAWKKKPWKERLLEEGGDPRQIFQEMRDEALKADTPEAKIDALEKAYQARLDAIEAEVRAEREARTSQEKAIAQERQERAFERDFEHAMKLEGVQPLLEEYEPEDLLPIVRTLRDDPETLFAHAERLGVDLGFDLTDPSASYNILHIFQVLRAQHDEAVAKRQRLRKSAEPQASQPGQQPAEAKKPTVNGTEAKNAGTTLSNDLAASSAGAPPDHSGESHKDRLRRLAEMFG
jgi:hypothetical protein